MEKYGKKPKLFTGEWFKNFWYYHHTAVIIIAIAIVCVVIIANFSSTLTVSDCDIKILYGGNSMGMWEREAFQLEDIAASFANDANGDKKADAKVEYCLVEGSDASQEAMITFDSQLIYGDSMIYLCTEKTLGRVLDYYKKTENDNKRYDDFKRYDLSALCEKYGIGEDRIIRDDLGKVCAVSIAGSPIFDGIDLDKDNGGKGLFLSVRALRAGELNEDKEKYEAVFSENLRFAEHIIESIPKN